MTPCTVCGRPLRATATRGIGPVCWRKLHPPPSRRAPAMKPATDGELTPGQTELPLQPMQPTLWSL